MQLQFVTMSDRGDQSYKKLIAFCREHFSSPGRSPGRAIVRPPASVAASALAKCESFYVKVFYVMDKALSGELSCPCDRSCSFMISNVECLSFAIYTTAHRLCLISFNHCLDRLSTVI